ncbi:MAG: OmpA family protein [Agriterribacter sp.]
MKALLIITSIILLSFQINRLYVNHADGNLIQSEAKILNSSFVTKESLPEIDATYRSAKSVKKENVNLNTVATVKATTTQVAKKAVVKTTAGAYYNTQQNANCKLLHKFVKETKNYISFTTVTFDFNKHNALDTEQFNTILQYADKLIFDSTLRISIAGFADIRGSEGYNEKISWLRADDIKKYMVELGVKENQVLLSANGIDDPVADNATDEGRAMNRRVELALLQ